MIRSSCDIAPPAVITAMISVIAAPIRTLSPNRAVVEAEALGRVRREIIAKYDTRIKVGRGDWAEA